MMMNVKKFETQWGTAYVYYNRLPTAEDLAPACAHFLRQVEEEKRKRALKELQEKEAGEQTEICREARV